MSASIESISDELQYHGVRGSIIVFTTILVLAFLALPDE